MLNIAGLFTRETIIRHLAALPPLKTVVMDTIFTDRPQIHTAMVSTSDILATVHALPFVRRGAPSVPATKEQGSWAWYEPLAARPNVMVTGADLNNLKLMGQGGKEDWARGRTDHLRRGIRKTAEAVCMQALSGRVQWPVQLEGGGWDIFDVDFGAILSLNVAAAAKWDHADCKLADIFETLTDMQEAIEEHGYGSTAEIWAGKTAYNKLFIKAEASETTAKIRVELTDQGINIGGFLIKRRAEKYRNPQTGVMTPAVPDKEVRMIATDAGHRMPYCAVDDLDANLMAMPMFVKPIEIKDPSGYKLVGESKPFPIPNVKGICKALVVA
ncbi:Phage major capsid protein E [Desulfonatronum thiosulfatophilum]|uniref:Phage major capsid protein E n=1 Tax=Desulfonatronum thiosulfatophilum TaxID=617002 RepID=A0A1G6A7D0_9BACT|nr:major capsid protein [Desulfonatronum thiosulfatophilum]SDB03953.1 Phage major capsid protein E [Desulfonatronum thiosulfatophilum]